MNTIRVENMVAFWKHFTHLIFLKPFSQTNCTPITRKRKRRRFSLLLHHFPKLHRRKSTPHGLGALDPRGHRDTTTRRPDMFGNRRLFPSHFQFASRRSTTGSFNNWKHLFGNSRKCFQSCWRHVHGSAYSPSEVQSDGTYSILQARPFQHWFKNWQHLRRNKLTASTFGLAIGFWPRRRVQLWLEKIGAKEPFSRNLAICWNNVMEEEALERYKLITGNKVVFPEFQVHGERYLEDDWLGASPDGVVENIVYDLPSRGVLEIKCPFFRGDMSRASPWKRIPLYCMPQAQGLMEILDKDWMDFYVWTPKGSSLFRVYRDPEYWSVLKIALSDFWWNHVQPARELYSESLVTDPLVQLKSLKPEPRHELCSYIVYESKRAVDNSKLLVREINGILHRKHLPFWHVAIVL